MEKKIVTFEAKKIKKINQTIENHRKVFFPQKHSKRSKIHCDSTHLPLLWQRPWPVPPFARPFGADVVAPPPASPHPGRAQPRRCRSPRRPQRRAVTEGHGLRTPRPRRCRRDGQERTPLKTTAAAKSFPENGGKLFVASTWLWKDTISSFIFYNLVAEKLRRVKYFPGGSHCFFLAPLELLSGLCADQSIFDCISTTCLTLP